MLTMTKAEYLAEGERLFGADRMSWRFVCPSCGHVATPKEWQAAGATEGEIAFSCIGRHMPNTAEKAFKKAGGPCNYAGGGLFKLNPVTVTDGERKHQLFDFDRSATSAAA